MIKRRDRTMARTGIDPLAEIVCYGTGVVVLYHMAAHPAAWF
jgi:hypothetical protein